jgi:hormone-sensitive lipase
MAATTSNSEVMSFSDGVNFKISKSMMTKKYESVNELVGICGENFNYYQNDKTFVGSRMCSNFEKLKEFLQKSVPVIKEIETFAHTYDFDDETPGNGYRSFIFIYESAVDYSMKVCHYINDNRRSLLFRKSLYQKYVINQLKSAVISKISISIFNFFFCRELEVCAQLIESILLICEDLIKMHKNSENGNLYSHEYSHDNLITRAAKVVNQTCFYGRAIGFQFVESLRSILKFLAVSLACFSEAYFTDSYMIVKTTNFFLKHPSYFMDPEMCARRIMNVSHNADVMFCKVIESVVKIISLKF